ncbi:GLUT4 regulating protein TUG-domain-containing protein [Xylariomycetidae sp. FL0641]|nr:GLUT4 regulating protein TUG-domain-containing protein [Xylariomycetidae sp. FL0641]
MASNVKVVGTDLRQVTVKVSPGTYLTEVLEQACTKLKVNPAKFLLKHKQRQLDLSQDFRTSGLIPGARLELIVRANTPTAINVALQLPAPESSLFPPHGRATEKLPSDFTIWQILRQFESGKASAGKNLNFTQRGVAQMSNGTASGSGQLFYETPHVVIEKRTLTTFVDFQKTLSQLGYNSGSVLMRLSFHKTDKTLADAMAEIQSYFQIEEKENKPKETTATGEPHEPSTTVPPSSTDGTSEVTPEIPAAGGAPAEDTIDSTTAQPPPSSDAMEVDQPVSADHRPVTVFSAPTSNTPAAALRQDYEEDYVPDTKDAIMHQQRLKAASENKRLLSDRELEEKAAEQAAKVAALKSILIKVRCPGNVQVQWAFGPADTGATLHREVRGVMRHPEAPFKLALPPGRTLIRDDSTKTLIRGYGLASNSVVNFLWDDSVSADVRAQPFCHDRAAAKAKDIVIPEIPEGEVRDDGPAGPSPAASKPKEGGASTGMKKPKWLKGLTKK